MKVQDYKSEILLKLGAPIVEVEISELLTSIINASFRELKKYISVSKLSPPIVYAPKIDLTKYNVQTIHYIMRDTRSDTGNKINDAFYLSQMTINSAGNLQDYRRFLRVQGLKNTISTDLDYTYDYPYLYVSAIIPRPTTITLCYTPRYKKVSELDDPYWEDILMRLSLANTKITLGRVRGKYKLSNSLYELDASQLLQEGTQELTELRTFLSENLDLALPLD